MSIQYTVIYSGRKTIRITVERNREVIVRVPRRASQLTIARALESKQLWIWQKVQDLQKYPNPPHRKEFVAGETFLVAGQQYRLAFAGSLRGEVEVEGQELLITQNDRHIAARIIRAWYIRQAKMLLPQRIQDSAAAMGIKYKRVCIRDLKYAWGSCTPEGTLTFNWRIVQCPPTVVKYLIIHELAHILVPNHSEKFQNLVAVHAPWGSRARSWLKEHGAELEW